MALTQAELDRILGRQSVVQRAFDANQPTISTQRPSSPSLSAISNVLETIRKPLDVYELNKNIPIVGGATFADVTGLNQVAPLTQDVSYGRPVMRGGSLQTMQADPRLTGLVDFIPAAGIAAKGGQVAAKAGAREIARQIETGTGVFGKGTIDPRQYLFIGENSQSWNKNLANKAIKLEKQGLSPEEIWSKTGTVRGVDGKLRQEISDVPAKFNTPQDLIEKANQIKLRNQELKQIVAPIKNQKDLFPKQLTEARKPYKEEIERNLNLLNKNYGLLDRPEIGQYAPLVVEHPELYKAYPDMERITINQGINKGEGHFGAYYPSLNLDSDSLSVYRAALNRTKEGNPSWGGKSTSLHELQHAIQERENFARGGSPDEFISELLNEKNLIDSQISELNKQMSIIAKSEKMTPVEKNAYEMLMEQRMQLVPRYQQLQDNNYIRKQASDQYQRLGGEAESRLTQERMGLSPEERLQYFPYNKGKYGLDVPFSELIIRGLIP